MRPASCNAEAFRKNKFVQIGSMDLVLIRYPTASLRCLLVAMRTMLLRGACLFLFGVLLTLLFSRHRVRLVESLRGVLLPQLRILSFQLCNPGLQFRIFVFQVINPLRQSLNGGLQLHHQCRQLTIARLLTCSVHTRCLSNTVLQYPSFHGEMDIYVSALGGHNRQKNLNVLLFILQLSSRNYDSRFVRDNIVGVVEKSAGRRDFCPTGQQTAIRHRRRFPILFILQDPASC